MLNKHILMLAALSIHSSHKAMNKPTSDKKSYAETVVLNSQRTNSSPTSSPTSTEQKTKSENVSSSSLSSSSSSMTAYTVSSFLAPSQPSLLSSSGGQASSSSTQSTISKSTTNSSSVLSSSASSSSSEVVPAPETQNKKIKKPAPLKLSSFRSLWNTDGTDVIEQLNNLPEDQYIDALSDSENSKNLIRAFEFFRDANDRKGMASLITTCNKLFQNGKLVTNSTARLIARKFMTTNLESDEQETRANIKAAQKKLEEHIAQSHNEVHTLLTTMYKDNLRDRELLDETYSMGPNSPRSQEHALTSEYNNATKYTANITILDDIKAMNSKQLHLSLDDITQVTHEEIKKEKETQTNK